ncbi:MAG: Holliday junction resolvase RuvX [Candidatus Omnitrophica bacterium]|nr:Holliday junction resolvase RuvX [Candidatus Omnitrophota bacterium]
MPRVLALDVGEKRIGIAISDALGMTAQGIETHTRGDVKSTLDRIRELVRGYDVATIVVGLPFNMNGTKGASAVLVESFIETLKNEFSVKVVTVDERLTTAQSERLLLEADISRKKRKTCVDKMAAQLILQTYLESNA